MKRAHAANLDDVVIAIWMHRIVLARIRLAAASAALAECDADAARAGLCLKTLRRATQRSRQTAADRRLDAAADAYVRAMETTTFGGVTGCRAPGALSPESPRLTLPAHPSGEAA